MIFKSRGSLDVPNQPKPAPVIPIKPPQTSPKAIPTAKHDDLLEQFDKAEIRPERLSEVKSIAERIKKNQARYQTIEKATGVPWYIVGCIHHKECSLDFRGYLGNGDLIIGTGKKSWDVPAGRGPFQTFEEGAIDALGNKKGWPWDLGSALYFLLGYNGHGYEHPSPPAPDPRHVPGDNRPIPSPYLFSGTTLYACGGFPRDRIYDPKHVITNPGCVAIIKALNVFPEVKS